MQLDRHTIPVVTNARRPSPAVDARAQDPAFALPPRVRPPAGAPNVLLVLIDDMGFGSSSTFGGPCRMPIADRLAENGLKYSRFHTTALCAPTRAALLTGRNHHSVGMGHLPEMATAAPGYTGMRPESAATIARVLQGNGYATGAFGKMHQTPVWETTPSGPFDRWPTREGFDKFYGFLGAEVDQFTPNLIDGMTRILPPRTPEEGYHLSEDIADQAINWIDNLATVEPDKPWFCYLSYGACHAPFHVPESYRDRYRGEFDDGWDVQRERTLARQRELGVVPSDARLAPWSGDLPHWDDMNADQRRVAARLMELYAAMAEHTDDQTGRVLAAIERLGQLDNTVVIYILGDNGASAEGGFEGSANYLAYLNGSRTSAAEALEQWDELGGPNSYPHYNSSWALAMDTPYQWTKQVASHYGGTRNGMIVSWPEGIAAAGEVRGQWHHVIDVAPTLLELIGIPEPHTVDGARQKPMEGVSFGYTFADADAPEQHVTQYFELFGNRGIYDRGWTAVTKHRTPWELGATDLVGFADDLWELYDTTSDWTQAADVAEKYPEKVAELKEKFLIEAARYQVLPLDDRTRDRPTGARSGHPAAMSRVSRARLLPTLEPLEERAAPNFKNTSFCLDARVTVAGPGDATATAVLLSVGGRFGGFALYLHEGVPTFCQNVDGRYHGYVRATAALASGEHSVSFEFGYDGGGYGRGGTGRLLVDRAVVGEGRIARTTPLMYGMGTTLDVGIARGTPVSAEFLGNGRSAFGASCGTLHHVDIAIGPDQLAVPRQELERVDLATH